MQFPYITRVYQNAINSQTEHYHKLLGSQTYENLHIVLKQCNNLTFNHVFCVR